MEKQSSRANENIENMKIRYEPNKDKQKKEAEKRRSRQ